MIEALFVELGPYLAAGVAVILGLLGIYKKGKTEARDEIKADTVDKIIEVDKKEREIEKETSDLGAKSRRDELRKYASDSE